MAGKGFLANGPEVQLREYAGGAMLYDASRAGNATPNWFDPQWWRERGTVAPMGEGRGSAWFIEADGRRMVLRHYRRGGLVGRFLHDRYGWRGRERTRCFREFRLLHHLRSAGMHVPAPVAAGYHREGATYRADLLTNLVPQVSSLARLVHDGPVPLDTWVRVGAQLRRFHARGLCHADLNAHNILLDPQGTVWVIDLDRGRLRRPGWWQDSNLVRLRRSLEKLTARLPASHFTGDDWHVLLDAYFAAAAEAAAAGAAAGAARHAGGLP